MNTSWLSILSFVGLSQALFSAVIILLNKNKKTYDRIMFFWLLIIGLRFWLVGISNLHSDVIDVGFSATMVPLTFGPFLYLYTMYLLKDKKRHSPFDILHYLPFLISLAVYFLIIKDSSHWISNVFYQSIPLAFAVSALVYTGLVFYQLQKFRKHFVKNVFSNEIATSRLNWIYYVAIVFLITYFLYFILKAISGNFSADNSNIEMVLTIGLLWLSYSVSYFGIQQSESKVNFAEPDWVQNIESNKEDTKSNDSLLKEDTPANPHLIEDVKTNNTISNNEAKTQESEIQSPEISEETQQQLTRIQQYMTDEKPYLNPELTLPELAMKLNIPKHHLTFLLNQHLKKNFFEYVNEFRAKEVMRRLNDSKFDHLTLVAVAYDCGFNTKSTFNSFFKQFSGFTPSDYKKSLKKDPS